ncbi:MAG: hypothetical protein ACE5NP_10135 [Anaerolineae bacterium]
MNRQFVCFFMLMVLVVMSIACGLILMLIAPKLREEAILAPTPLPTPVVVRMEKADWEGYLSLRGREGYFYLKEFRISWEELKGGKILEFKAPIVAFTTGIYLRIPDSVDLWAQATRLNENKMELSLGYLNDEEEKEHAIRPYSWRGRPEDVRELWIDATWRGDDFYTLDAKVKVQSGEIIMHVYGSR